jgi:hypothetical protein
MAINNYYGYVPPSNTIDWAKLTGGLVDTITGISDERQQQREELGKLNMTNQQIVSSVDSYSNQTLNEFVLSGSEEARSTMKTWYDQLRNREIKPAEYKNRMNNLMTNWTDFGTATKTFNSRIQEGLKRSIPGEDGLVVASGFELYKIDQMAQLSDLKNKKIFIDPQTGNIMSGELDPNTGVVDPNTLVTGAALNNPENIQSNRVDLNGIVALKVKNWGEFRDERNGTTKEGQALNPLFAQAVASLTGSLIGTPEAIASIIDDNTDTEVAYYSNQAGLNAIIEDRISTQNDARKILGQEPMTQEESDKFIDDNSFSMMQVQRDGNGVMRPIPTQEQIDFAKKTIQDEIYIQMDSEQVIEQKEKIIREKKSDGGNKPTENQKDAKKKGALIRSIISSQKNVAARLKSESGGVYDFTWDSKTNSWSATKKGDKNPSYSGMKNSADMYKIFGGGEENYYKEGTKQLN